MEPAVVSLCSLIAGDERERLQLLISRIQKIQAKHTDTRPLANAFCFTGSSASPTPAMCSQRTERQAAPGDQATPSGKTKREKVSSQLLEKEGRALERWGTKEHVVERGDCKQTQLKRVLYRSSHFPRGQHTRSARSLLSDTLLLLHISELPTPRKRSTSVKYQRLKSTRTNANLFFLNQC